jgi:hypothetical protein
MKQVPVGTVYKRETIFENIDDFIK